MTVLWLVLFVGLLAVEVEPVDNALASFREPIPHTGLPFPDLIQGEDLSPAST